MATVTTSAGVDGTRTTADGALTAQRLAELRRRFDANPHHHRMLNAVTQTPIDDVALNRGVVTSLDHTFSHLLDDWTVTNQKKSGRCWMFAGLNLLRVGAMRKMNLKEFQFSQNHTLFHDKLERANYFFEQIIATADRDVDDRVVAHLLTFPLDDGGQWNMFVNVISRHGLVPQAVMPESQSSSDTARMNYNLLFKLREGARLLRVQAAERADCESLRRTKDELIEVIYRMLCIHLGVPPRSFDWQWNDKDRQFHRDGELTPQQFAQQYVTLPLDDYVCLVHDPRPEHDFGRTYTVAHLGNVVGGPIVKYLNVPIEVMKDVAMRSIMSGEPVWMGCDVAPQMRRDMGLWDARLFDYAGVYDTQFGLDKAQRLIYHQSAMTHAMLFTGVDVVAGQPRRWRVENSWGEENGRKGFYVMNDSWFDEYMFEIAARREALPADLRDAIEQEPIVLPPWDPMGSLARR